MHFHSWQQGPHYTRYICQSCCCHVFPIWFVIVISIISSLPKLDLLMGMDTRSPHGSRILIVDGIASLNPSNIQVYLDILFLALCGVCKPLQELDICNPLMGLSIYHPLMGLFV